MQKKGYDLLHIYRERNEIQQDAAAALLTATCHREQLHHET